jgi:hypothetical protein
MKKYIPELGQEFFGQPYKEIEASNLLIAALNSISRKLSYHFWNKYQKELDCPFRNSGTSFKNKTFEVESYSWDDTKKQKYNFKWQDIQISWYKYLGRGTTVNKQLSNDKIEKLLEDCLNSLPL